MKHPVIFLPDTTNLLLVLFVSAGGRSKEESELYMKVNCSVAAGSAVIGGILTKTTNKVTDEFGRSAYGHLESIDEGGLINTFVSGKPNEPIKDINISVAEQFLSTVLTENEK